MVFDFEEVRGCASDFLPVGNRPANWRILAALCLTVCKQKNFACNYDRGMLHLEWLGVLEALKESMPAFKTVKSQTLRTLRDGTNSQGKRVHELFDGVDSAGTFTMVYRRFLAVMDGITRADYAVHQQQEELGQSHKQHQIQATSSELKKWELDAATAINRLWEHGEISALRRLHDFIKGSL